MRTWDRLADLELTVDAYRLAGREVDAGGWPRTTTEIRIAGRGHEGVGEDVNYFAEEQLAFRDAGPCLPLAGRWTLHDLSAHLEGLPLFVGEPTYPASRDYRRWAYESAALDLALRQAGTTLADALERSLAPLHFVASLALGDAAGLDRLRRLHAAQPELRFKLDATPFWDDAVVAELAAMQRVSVVDFKGAYVGTPVDQDADPRLYARVVARLPEVIIEDPHRTPACDEILSAHWQRVSWDAPIHAAADIAALDHPPTVVNLKPSRFGALERLCDAYDYCTAHGISAYGGGQFELGPGRGQIQYLAALFHPDAANDVAPAVFNTTDDFSTLPPSPLPPAGGDGFRWASE